ncbi:MAG: nitronate monooxygenase [Bacteroidales bacterium]
MKNRVCKIFGIEHPIIQGGMVWCSGWKLASAVSKGGGLGLIGAGSMHIETLRHHIVSCREALNNASAQLDKIVPFGVNLPLLYPQIEEAVELILREKVPIVFTSAGSPKRFTSLLQSHGVVVAHVVSSSKFAKKCEEAGVDVVVAEGFEAGGHNGREETTTLCLIPQVRDSISLPLIAAGGIASAAAYRAAFALGAEGVQVGTRFALCSESSAHPAFKEYCRALGEGDTRLLLKKMVPTRMALNSLGRELERAEEEGASVQELLEIKGERGAKRGIFEGDIEFGEIEVGQVVSMIKNEESAAEILLDLLQ